MHVIDPYSVDPVLENDTQEPVALIIGNDYAGDNTVRDNRAQESSTSWCECGRCEAMASDAECLCCSEIRNCRQHLKSQEISCITEHEDFTTLFLTPCVLRHYALTVNQTRGYGEAITWSNRYVNKPYPR